MPFGKGRVAIFGEAAMFSAQVATIDGRLCTAHPEVETGFHAEPVHSCYTLLSGRFAAAGVMYTFFNPGLSRKSTKGRVI
jgi:hypothetical protein